MLKGQSPGPVDRSTVCWKMWPCQLPCHMNAVYERQTVRVELEITQHGEKVLKENGLWAVGSWLKFYAEKVTGSDLGFKKTAVLGDVQQTLKWGDLVAGSLQCRVFQRRSNQYRWSGLYIGSKRSNKTRDKHWDSVKYLSWVHVCACAYMFAYILSPSLPKQNLEYTDDSA